MTWHPSAETLKAIYEQMSATHLTLESSGAREEDLESLAELARTLAKGGPYAATVERWARDHGYA